MFGARGRAASVARVTVAEPVMSAVLGRSSRDGGTRGGRSRSWLVRAVALTLLVPTSYVVQSLGPGGTSGAAAAVPTPPPAAVNPLPSMKKVTTPGPTAVSGTLSTDTVWGPSGSPYVVTGLFKVGQDVSLTLLPGTVVKLQSQSARISVLGQILALGSPQDRVVFTSYKDDTVSGDTNGDGSATAPARGDWSGIDVYGNDTVSDSTKRPVSVFDYVDVRYGGYGAGSGCPGFGAVKAASSHARMVVSNSIFTEALYAGVASGKVDADGFVGIYDSHFASSRCGVASVQAGDTNGQTEVVGNTFAEDLELAAAYFLNPRQTGFWFNTADAPVIAAGSEYLDISISYNELLGGVQTWGSGYQQVYDLRRNWWGDNLNERSLPGPCMTYEAARAYQPPVTTAPSSGCYADNGKVLVTGWERLVLPALSAPPADFLDSVAEPYAPRVGPVDTYRGRLTYQVDDLTIQDAGKAITATRTYRSHAPGNGDLGAGWQTSFSEGLSTDLDGVTSMTLGDGSSVPFAEDAAAGYVPQRGVVADFASDEDGSVVTTPNDTTYTFDPSGLLTEMLLGDPGHQVDIDRNAAGKLSRVTGVSGRYLDYTRDSSHLTRIADATGRGVDFDYADDHLTTVTGAAAETVETYEYGTDGRLTKVLTASDATKLALGYDPEGRVAWVQERGSGRADIEYDSANGRRVVTFADDTVLDQYYDAYGRVVIERTRGGSARHVVYDGFGRPIADIPGIPAVAMEGYAPPAGATLYDFSGDPVVTVDPLGWATVTTFNGKHKPVKTTNPDGSTITRHYGSQGRVDSVIDPKGETWTFTYADDGQVRVVTDPLGRTQEQTYETDGDLATSTDETGATTTYLHDALGRTSQVTGPRSNTWQFAYTYWDQPKTMTTPAGGVYRSTFNDDRMVLTVEDPLEKVTTYGYDTAGRVDSITVDSASTTAPVQVAQFEYDLLGRPKRLTDARGNFYTRTYTLEGWPETNTDPDGVTSTIAYDPAGREWRVTDDLGAVAQTVHDRAGQVLKTQTPDGATETRTYDSMGNLATHTSGIGGKWTFEYNVFGQVTKRTDPATKVFTWAYDKVGRLTKQTDEANWVTDLAYGPSASRTVTTTDALGLVSEITRNATGQVASRTDGRGGVTTYTYKGDGSISTVTDAEGGLTSYAHDLAGNLTEVTDAVDRTVAMAYDGLGRLDTRTFADGTVESFDYDDVGNVVLRQDRDENQWAYDYTAGNRLEAATDPLENLTQYAYDDLGRVASVTDPTGVVTQTAYDPVGRPAVRSNTRDASWVTTYDLAGNVLTEKNPAGFTTTYTYDLLNRVKTEKPGTLGTATFTYNAVGGLLTRVQGSQTLTWEHDGRHQTTASIDARTNKTLFDYDLAGNLVKTTRPTGNPDRWTYDLTGRITGAEDGVGNTTAYTYNDAGDLTSAELPGGGQYGYTYDEVGRLATETAPGSTDPIRYDYDGEGHPTSTAYPSGRTVTTTYDDAGNLETQASGAETRTFGYDDAGRLASVTAPSGSIGYTYDDRGLLATGTDQFGTTTYGYDATERLTSIALGTGATTTYGYNANNQLSTVRGPSNLNYAYDGSFGRLTSVTAVAPTPYGSETYTYDADGRLTKKSSSNLELSATYDASGQIASTTSTLGTLVNPEEGTATYTHDAAGRLKSRTLKVGTTTVSTSTYDWDADGNRTSLDTGSGPVTYSYDQGDRLTSSSDGATYDYDDDGNLDSVDRPGTANDASHTYNGFGELVGTTVGAQSASYERDGLGRVIERTSAGASDTYGYDGQSTSITAFDAATAPATSLVRTPGQDLISLVPSGGTSQKATTNLHGDLSVLRNQSNGQFTYSALFEPFGTAAKTGSTPVQLGFQAMPQDPVGGLVDMGFRSYDPATARFTAADDRVGDLDRGITINRYQYGSAAPLDYFDPDGHDFLGINLNLNINLPSLGNLLDGIGDLLGGIRSLGNTIRGALASGGRALTSAVGSTISHIKSSVTSLQGNLITGAKSIAGSARSAFNRASALVNQVSRADMSAIHTTLDIAGFVPVIGEAADLGNAVLYLIEGDTKNALISFAAMIPVLGSLAIGARTAGRASSFARLANQPWDTAKLTRFADNPTPAADDGVRTFHTVQGAGDAARLRGGGAPWPSSSSRAALGQGVYSFGSRAEAEGYAAHLAGRGASNLEVMSFDVAGRDLASFRSLDIDSLADPEAFMSKHSQLWGGTPNHGFEHLTRGTQFGTEHFFDKSVFGNLGFGGGRG